MSMRLNEVLVDCGFGKVDESEYHRVKYYENECKRVNHTRALLKPLEEMMLRGGEHVHRVGTLAIGVVLNKLKEVKATKSSGKPISTSTSIQARPVSQKRSLGEDKHAMVALDGPRGLSKRPKKSDRKHNNKVGQCSTCKAHGNPSRDTHRKGSKPGGLANPAGCPYFSCVCAICKGCPVSEACKCDGCA